jgi:predicted house-cleaning noncanonical NTP pyrophosphatase (MazG superfamily)
VSESRKEPARAELRITPEDARSIASLLRYAISLNTTAGLVSPTQRRLATSTYRAVELAALVLEGMPLEEAIRESNRTWTGSLAEDHLLALELLEKERETLREVLSNHLSPEQLADYLEIKEEQFLDLLRQNPAKHKDSHEPGS